MNNEFVNRLGSFTTALATLHLEEHLPVWQNQPPIVFTEKVTDAATAVETLQEVQKDQEAGITGSAEQKEREKAELERAAHVLGQALAIYFRDRQDETQAAGFDLTASDWLRLRDLQLLAKSKLVVDAAETLANGPAAADAAKYGITPATVTALVKERNEYDKMVNAPGVAISVRKALTNGFRPAFSIVEEKFKDLDKLILQFGGSEAGRGLVAAWKNARMQKGPGSGNGQPAPAPVPATV
ncbi:MAG TPA: hypothetical protein VIT91_14290 [Chthoniobacterales bacterium]